MDHSIALYNCSLGIISNNVLGGGTYSTIQLYKTDKCNISGNTIINSPVGIDETNTSSNNLITGNLLEAITTFYAGISPTTTISNNKFIN